MKNLSTALRSGWRLTKIQAHTRPDHRWPEIYFGLVCQKQLNEGKSSNGPFEKPKLDNARKLRGINFTDPDDKQFKETTLNARTKLELSMEAATLCKLKTTKSSFPHTETCGEPKQIRKSKLACIVEAH